MSQKRILIIDDDEELCEEVSEILRDESYHVSVANDGLKGYKMLEKNYFDLVLLDMKLPGLTGIEVLKLIKEQQIDLKVLIITGRPNQAKKVVQREGSYEDKEEELISMADGIINKPFNIAKLLKKIDELANAQ
jgi:DNA-binding response OmpR family regulator